MNILSRKIFLFTIILLSTLLPGHTLYTANTFIEHIEGSAINIYEENGNHLFSTAMEVVKGDRYISEDNFEYIIKEVTANKAVAKKIGKINLLAGNQAKNQGPFELASVKNKTVAIYHTHNGESYEPGKHNVSGKGEIHEIGQTLKESLEKIGVKAIHSENLHLPHDGFAYERSRATAVDLAKKNPGLILDLHRDGVPDKNEYLKKVDGKIISQIRIVIGRQNPNNSANDQLARQLKATADRTYPGLIKDIFYGRGNYNQSIAPRSLLLEFGTHVNNKGEVTASAQLLAEPLKELLYGKTTPAGGGKRIFRNLFWIILALITALLAYLFINEKNWQGVLKRIKKIIPLEILDKNPDDK